MRLYLLCFVFLASLPLVFLTDAPTTVETTLPTTETASSSSTGENTETTAPAVDTTTQAAATTPSTTEAQPWAVFDVDCDTEPGYCYYNLTAPQLDKEQFEAQEANLTTDQSVYAAVSKTSYLANSAFLESDAYYNYTQLVDLYNQTLEDYNALLDAITVAQNESSEVRSTISQAWDVLNGTSGVFSNVNSCYFSKCSRYTPPTTTTTTTRKPTTNICAGITCQTFPNQTGTCLLSNGQCQCPGNLYQNSNCGPVVCSATLANLKDGMPGPFWSLNYNRSVSDTSSLSYGSNNNCLYRISASTGNFLNVNLHNQASPSYNLDPTATLTIKLQSFNYVLPNDKTKVQSFLQDYINEYPVKTLQFQFKSGAVKGKGYYFDFDVVEVPPAN